MCYKFGWKFGYCQSGMLLLTHASRCCSQSSQRTEKLIESNKPAYCSCSRYWLQTVPFLPLSQVTMLSWLVCAVLVQDRLLILLKIQIYVALFRVLKDTLLHKKEQKIQNKKSKAGRTLLWCMLMALFWTSDLV